MATKAQRLGEAIENLQAGALRAMRQSDEAAARELLQVSIVDCDTSFVAALTTFRLYLYDSAE